MLHKSADDDNENVRPYVVNERCRCLRQSSWERYQRVETPRCELPQKV